MKRSIQARAIARVTSPLSLRTTTATTFRPSTSILESKVLNWQRSERAWRHDVFESTLFLCGKNAEEMVELELGPSFISLWCSDGENADPLLNVVRDWWRDLLHKNVKTKESKLLYQILAERSVLPWELITPRCCLPCMLDFFINTPWYLSKMALIAMLTSYM